MKRKNELPLLFTLAVLLASAPAAAHAAQQKDSTPTPPPQVAQPAQPQVDQDQGNALRTISGPYRLTYTLTEMDREKRIGSQQYAIVLDADARTSRTNFQSSIPVQIISFPASSTKSTEYMKAETRIDANLRQAANGMELITGVGQNTFANETNDSPATDGAPPITRTSSLTTTVLLTGNKPVVIGQLDIPGSTHSLQIQVELKRLP